MKERANVRRGNLPTYHGDVNQGRVLQLAHDVGLWCLWGCGERINCGVECGQCFWAFLRASVNLIRQPLRLIGRHL